MNFKPGDKVTAIIKNYTITQIGWTGVVKRCNEMFKEVTVMWDQDGNTWTVRQEHLKLNKGSPNYIAYNYKNKLVKRG